jgi:hypothetical protein
MLSGFSQFLRDMDMSEEAPTILVDWTEHAAAMTLLRAVIAATAAQHEMLRPGAGQQWINNISEACQTAILSGDISGDFGLDVEAVRRKTMEHVNRMLAGLLPETGTTKPRN